MKKDYNIPAICIIKMQGGDLLEGLTGSKVIHATTDTINKGNAQTAAAKYLHGVDLWDYDDDEVEDFEDKEDEKKR